MAEDVKAGTGDVVDLTEGSELVAGAAATSQPDPVAEKSGPMWRKILGVVLAVFAMIVLVLSVEAVWLKTTLENEDQFVETFAPLAEDTAVVTAVSVRIADGVVESEEVQAFITDGLPDGLSVLAIPISAAIREVVQTVTVEVVESDAFGTAWETALRGTYTVANAVLTGNDAALVSEGGQVKIDLNEIVVVVTDRIEEGRGIDLPDIDADLGSIVIYESDDLASAQAVVQAISTIAWVLPLVALLLVIAAIWAYPDNRWMVAFLAFGTALVGLLGLALLRVTESTLLGNISVDVAREAGDAVFDVLTAGIRAATWALIVLALIIGFFAWVNGPSPRAQSLKLSAIGGMDSRRRAPEAEPSGLATFLADWKRSIQGAVVALGFASLLFGSSPSGISVFLTAVVVFGIAVLVEVLAGSAEAPVPAPQERVDT
jgi:hypothetical protein